MKYIIMAGGIYPRWETPRQLTEIHGEPLVARTIRLLKENGVDDIAITSHDERFKQFGIPVLQHDNGFISEDGGRTYWVDAFYPTNEPVCYLMGDVFFSRSAVEMIVNYEQGEDIMFFASAFCNGKGYIKPHAEPFAFKVWNQTRFKESIAITKTYQDKGMFNRRPIAWELWQVIKGSPLNIIAINYKVIDDYTCDIDDPSDAKRIELLKVE